VIVMVRVAEWLIAPAPLVPAETETVSVPGGVPGLPPLLELPPLQEVRADATVKRRNKPKSCKTGSPRLAGRAAIASSTTRTGRRSA
jgi:hypothetical protein